MGVENNAMQFYPDASRPEAAVHPGLYQRHQGKVDLSSVRGPGFGCRLGEIKRELPLQPQSSRAKPDLLPGKARKASAGVTLHTQ